MAKKNRELVDFVSGEYDEFGRLLRAGALSLTKVETMDLISEGEIEGLVEGEYVPDITQSNIGDIGFRSVNYQMYDPAPGTQDIRWLPSVFWNEVPVVNSLNQYNFQNVNVRYTKGLPAGEILSRDAELTITRSIGERLRGPLLGAVSSNTADEEEDPVKYYIQDNTDYSKIYRILNRECNAVIINVKVTQLFETNLDDESKNYGRAEPYTVKYVIGYRPVYSTAGKSPSFLQAQTVKVVGKLTYGYIKSSRIELGRKPSVYETDFIGWEVKISRITPEENLSSVRSQTFIDSITEVYESAFTYPHSAVVFSSFSAEYFSQIPDRAFDTRLLKVKVPSTYDPIQRTYNDTNGWDGTFKEEKVWTDNPVWCYYDLITNNRYGLGRYVSEDFVDKWSLYSISKYCDTIVSNGYGGLEPRFVCNLILTDRDEAFKVINDMASIFWGIAYYGHGFIYTVADQPSKPLVTFTNSNVLEGNFQYSSSSLKNRHTVAVVRYNDREDFYKPSIEYVEDVEGIKQYGLHEIDLTAFGCTSRGQAVRMGKWVLLSERTQTDTISFTAGLEAAYLRPGDVFQVFDKNRKTARTAGRVFNLTETNTDTLVELDSLIESGDFVEGADYALSVVIPYYNYDPSLVDNLTSNDDADRRKILIDSGIFTGWTNSYNESGRTNIVLNNFKFKDFDFSTNRFATWMIQPIATQDVERFINPSTDYYRVIRVEEREDNQYVVGGLSYSIQKYQEIETGLNFERDPLVYQTIGGPQSNVSVSVREENYTQSIDYTFASTDYSGVTNLYVYISNGAFRTGERPSSNSLAAVLPYDAANYSYVPTGTGSYYFAVYGYNAYSNTFSADPITGYVNITRADPIKNVLISSLTTTGTILTGISMRSTGYYHNISPTFYWQAGVTGDPDYVIDWGYRLSIREPSYTNTPSSTIYYDSTGAFGLAGVTYYSFDFAVNLATSGGPHRKYDVVVEAVDMVHKVTSAGNTLVPLSEVWDNVNGYDIIYISNDKVENFILSNIPSITNSGYITNQWIDPNGSIYIKFISGTLPTDIVGGYIYSSTGYFSGANVTGNIPIGLPITTGHFLFDTSKNLAMSPAQFTNIKTGYIALSLYDKFDEAYKNRGVSISSGLYVSNTVKVVPSGYSFSYNIGDYMNIQSQGSSGISSYFTTKEGNYIITKFRDENSIEYIIASREV